MTPDPSLPGLAAALDPRRMRDLLELHLVPLMGIGPRIRRCQVARVRHRPGERAIFQYLLDVERAGNRTVERRWVSGLLYPGERPARTARKLGRQPLDPDLWRATGALFEPFAFVPEIGMVIQVFPFDRRLPTAPLLAAQGSVRLRALLGDGEEWSVEAVRYRAGLAATFHLRRRVPDDGSPGRGLYLKVYRDGEAAATTLAVTDALARRNHEGDSDRFIIPETVAFDRELRAIVIRGERAERTLDEEIRDARDPAPAARRVARALADLHLSGVSLPVERTLESDIATLEADARRLAWALPSVGSEVRSRIDEVVRGLTAAAGAGPRALTHGDLKGDHVLLDERRLVLLDLDFAAVADPALDAGYLLAHLMALPHRASVRAESAERAVRAFAAEYRAHVPDAWGSRLAAGYAAGVVQVAGGFFRRQEPGWREKIPLLLRQARLPRARSLTSRASTPS